MPSISPMGPIRPIRRRCTVICGEPIPGKPRHFRGHNYTLDAADEADAERQVLAVNPAMDIQAVLFHDAELSAFDRAFITLIQEPLLKE